MSRRAAAVAILVLSATGCAQHQDQALQAVNGSQQSASPSAGKPSGSGATSASPGGTTTGAPVASEQAGQDGLAHASAVLAGLSPGRLPTTRAAATALLRRLPHQLAGADRRATGPSEAGWADGSTVTVAPVSEAAGPGHSTRAFFEAFANSNQFTLARRAAPGSRLLWFVGTSNDGKRQSAAAVADADGQWLYGFQAPSPAALDELVTHVQAALS